jgi:DNA ligase-1
VEGGWIRCCSPGPTTIVGDLAETVALVWPARPGANREPELSEVVDALRPRPAPRSQGLIEGWLDALDADGRWALLKLLTGGLRVGLSARLAKQAAADIADIDVAEVEEVWHVLAPPYEDLFAWLEGRSESPSPDAPGRFRPVMLAQALDETATSPSSIRPTTPPNGSGTASASRR